MNFCDFGALVLVTDPSETDVALITTGRGVVCGKQEKTLPLTTSLETQQISHFSRTVEMVGCDWCKIKMMLVVVACESDDTLITICHLKSCENSYEICCLGCTIN